LDNNIEVHLADIGGWVYSNSQVGYVALPRTIH